MGQRTPSPTWDHYYMGPLFSTAFPTTCSKSYNTAFQRNEYFKDNRKKYHFWFSRSGFNNNINTLLGEDTISLILLKIIKKKTFLNQLWEIFSCSLLILQGFEIIRFMKQHSKNAQFQHCDSPIDITCSGRNYVGENDSLLLQFPWSQGNILRNLNVSILF